MSTRRPSALPLPPPRIGRWSSIAIVFVSSACIMVIELVAGRVIACAGLQADRVAAADYREVRPEPDGSLRIKRTVAFSPL